jgi:hypothetical protein
MTTTIVAFHGPQASGKTTHVNLLVQAMSMSSVSLNIKHGFQRLAQHLVENAGDEVAAHPNAYKTALLAVSTWAESLVPTVWSSLYASRVRSIATFAAQRGDDEIIVTDDIRPQQNLDALIILAGEGFPVIFFRLLADEETRKGRCEVWRDPSNYTEQLLPKPDALPPNFTWVDVDTKNSTDDNAKLIRETVLGICQSQR